jgi:RHS repeat-associated protein
MPSENHVAFREECRLFSGPRTLSASGSAGSPQPSYYRARYYDSSAGRFLSEDQVGFTAGVNFYSYARNDPVNFNDPTGNDIICPKFLPWCRGPEPPACKNKNPKDCKLSVSCAPTPNTGGFSHCTVTVQDGSSFTAYDGAPSGNIWWSKIIVRPGRGVPPGPGTFNAPVPCDCAKKEADAINGYGLVYSFPLMNSNTAASMITAACGVSPNWPPGAWGASNGNLP